MAEIEYNKGKSLISRKPIKESEMSESRQYHRRMVRQAEERKESKATEKKEAMARKMKRNFPKSKDPYGLEKQKEMFESEAHKKSVAKGKAEERHGYYGPNPHR